MWSDVLLAHSENQLCLLTNTTNGREHQQNTIPEREKNNYKRTAVRRNRIVPDASLSSKINGKVAHTNKYYKDSQNPLTTSY